MSDITAPAQILADGGRVRPASVRSLRSYALFNGTLEELAMRPPGPGRGRLIVTPNLDHLRMLGASAAFRRAYAAADLYLLDSRAIDRAFLKGQAFCLTGADLAPEMLDRLAPGARVAVVGSSPEVEDGLRRAYPALAFSFLNPSMGYIRRRRERRMLSKALREGSPDAVFVCTGAPQSELFAAQLKRDGCDADILCCGSGLLFLTGVSSRAPRWMQQMGMEWFWRFISEPRTRRRYRDDALYLLWSLAAFRRLGRMGAADFGAYRLSIAAAGSSR